MTPAQNRAVWASANRLGIDSEALHQIVFDMFGVESLKKLNTSQATYLLRRLNDSYLPKNPYVEEYANYRQIAKIKALFCELKFSEEKKREWIFRSKSLKGEMNVSELKSDELLKKIKGREATNLIASLVKTKKYIESKNDMSKMRKREN